MADLDLVRRLGTAEHGLAVVATTRSDGSVQTSLVNAGVMPARTGDGDVVAFVARGGAVKLRNLHARPRAAVVFRSGWEWASVEGPATIVGPDDAHGGTDPDELRVLLRVVFTAAGGTHDDWDEYDRVVPRRGASPCSSRPAGHRQLMASDPATPRIPPLTNDLDDQARARHERHGRPRGGEHLHDARPPPRPVPQVDAVRRQAARRQAPGARDRELLILRTGYRCRSEYEWGQHVRIGRAAGITEDEIPRIQEGPTPPDGAPTTPRCSAPPMSSTTTAASATTTWAALAAIYDEKQLIEIPMVVGHYHLVAYTLRSLGVQREPGVPGFDA